MEREPRGRQTEGLCPLTEPQQVLVSRSERRNDRQADQPKFGALCQDLGNGAIDRGMSLVVEVLGVDGNEHDG